MPSAESMEFVSFPSGIAMGDAAFVVNGVMAKLERESVDRCLVGEREGEKDLRELMQGV